MYHLTVSVVLGWSSALPAWQQAFHLHFYKFTESRFPKPLTKEAVSHETLLSGGSLRSRVPKGRAAKTLYFGGPGIRKLKIGAYTHAFLYFLV